jgi:hypothetical protein
VLRLLFGPDHRLLLPGSFLGGAAFLVLADLISRLLIAPNELPVGVVTASQDGKVRVEPFVDWSDLEYLRLLDYRVDNSLVAKGFEESLENAVLSPGGGDRLIEERGSRNPDAPRP